jgi:hypothetical protein
MLNFNHLWQWGRFGLRGPVWGSGHSRTPHGNQGHKATSEPHLTGGCSGRARDPSESRLTTREGLLGPALVTGTFEGR